MAITRSVYHEPVYAPAAVLVNGLGRTPVSGVWSPLVRYKRPTLTFRARLVHKQHPAVTGACGTEAKCVV